MQKLESHFRLYIYGSKDKAAKVQELLEHRTPNRNNPFVLDRAPYSYLVPTEYKASGERPLFSSLDPDPDLGDCVIFDFDGIYIDNVTPVRCGEDADGYKLEDLARDLGVNIALLEEGEASIYRYWFKVIDGKTWGPEIIRGSQSYFYDDTEKESEPAWIGLKALKDMHCEKKTAHSITASFLFGSLSDNTRNAMDSCKTISFGGEDVDFWSFEQDDLPEDPIEFHELNLWFEYDEKEKHYEWERHTDLKPVFTSTDSLFIVSDSGVIIQKVSFGSIFRVYVSEKENLCLILQKTPFKHEDANDDVECNVYEYVGNYKMTLKMNNDIPPFGGNTKDIEDAIKKMRTRDSN